MREKLRIQSGAAAVEFAVILPLLVVIGLGICEFSLIYYDKEMITNASRVGARVGIGITDAPWSDTEKEIADAVDEYLKDQRSATLGNFLLRSLGTLNDTYNTTSTPNPDGTLTVTVTYTYTFLVIPNFIATIANPITLTGQTVMRFE